MIRITIHEEKEFFPQKKMVKLEKFRIIFNVELQTATIAWFTVQENLTGHVKTEISPPIISISFVGKPFFSKMHDGNAIP